MTAPAALFGVDGPLLMPTELARGPWDPTACHGGPVAAVMARAVELVDGGSWQVARLTVELLRPVPLSALRLTSEVARPGQKVSLVEAQLHRDDGVEVARARALRIRLSEVALPEAGPDEPVPPGPEHGREEVTDWAGEDVAFHVQGVELRFVEGSWSEQGPTAAWIRLRHPVVGGEEPTGLQRAVAAADFGNGISAPLPFDQYQFINPDLTVHLLRPPRGEWIGMRSRSIYGPLGAGLAESALFDQYGRIGRSVQSLLIAPA